MLAGILVLMGVLAFDGTAVILDRIAAIAGRRVIKASDIDRDLRLTEFLNREPLNFDRDARKKSVERLIDQQIIRQEIATGGYPRATDQDADELLAQLRKDRFGGSHTRMRAELSRYGLSEPSLEGQLLWQLTVLRFIDERFRPGVLVSDEDVQKYYDENLPELKRQFPPDSSFEVIAPKVRESLEGQEISKVFEAWLQQARTTTHVEYRRKALE